MILILYRQFQSKLFRLLSHNTFCFPCLKILRAWSLSRILSGSTVHISNVAFFWLFPSFWLTCQYGLIHFLQKIRFAKAFFPFLMLLRSYSILYLHTLISIFWHACVCQLDQEANLFFQILSKGMNLFITALKV